MSEVEKQTFERKETKGVKTLLGDPKKAVIKLSLPMVAAMSAQTIYNLVDAIWVSGLGASSLAAVGFIFPFFFLATALSNGIGIGGGAAISRRIGAKDKKGADSVAAHTFAILLATAFGITVIGLLFIEPLLKAMGAEGDSLTKAMEYGRIIFAGITLLFFLQTSVSLLRSEGDAKRAMIAMLGGVVLNMGLDPVFIYVLNFGVAGAAYATIISIFLVDIFVFYWLFIEGKTYVSFGFKGFKLSKGVIYDISRVGIPAAASHTSMALMAFFIVSIVARVGGQDGVAVYTTGWRVIALATMPMLGIASAVSAIAGAAFGAKKFENVKTTYLYSIKIGIIAEAFLAAVIYVFAPQISRAFTWSAQSKAIAPELIKFLRIVCFLTMAVPVGMVTAATFQGLGKGLYALTMTILRTLILAVPFAWLFGIWLDWGLSGVWDGITLAGFASMPIGFLWAITHINKLIARGVSEKEILPD